MKKTTVNVETEGKIISVSEDNGIYRVNILVEYLNFETNITQRNIKLSDTVKLNLDIDVNKITTLLAP